jgi:hypothetical protein
MARMRCKVRHLIYLGPRAPVPRDSKPYRVINGEGTRYSDGAS